MNKSQRIVAIVGLIIICTIALLSVAASATTFAYQDRIQPRTVIAGYSLSNLPRQQAAAVINLKQDELKQTKIPLTHEGQTAVLTLEELGINLGEPSGGLTPPPATAWEWASISYWSTFFSPKTVTLAYSMNEDSARQRLEQEFDVAVSPEDAKIIVSNGSLEIVPGRSGKSLSLTNLIATIEKLLSTGQVIPAAITAEEFIPTVTDQMASQTKTEVERSLQPIYLTADGRSFTIPTSDLYNLVTYTVNDATLTWSIPDDKLEEYLTKQIANKVTVKMVQKAIQSDTQEVVQEGKDGKTINIKNLVASVKQTITEQKATKDTPITIPVQTVTFTEKIVHPDYVAGLFEGLYIDINLTTQKMFVMNGQTKTVEYLISSGKPGTPTPIGVFYIKNKIELAQSRLYPGIWMRKWNALARNPDGSGYEGYGIHDLPAFNASYTLVEGESHLGRPVSHGCIRLGHDNASWFYDNVPVGTPINIHR